MNTFARTCIYGTSIYGTEVCDAAWTEFNNNLTSAEAYEQCVASHVAYLMHTGQEDQLPRFVSYFKHLHEIALRGEGPT